VVAIPAIAIPTAWQVEGAIGRNVNQRPR